MTKYFSKHLFQAFAKQLFILFNFGFYEKNIFQLVINISPLKYKINELFC
eukprot:TRINITY_DN14201_c0_g1_i1.p2 TRINITY_DN14201_c0_g1~~TRINITY_DN14201_c0_g1_i1.p2  ORF type:complete len:50 (-),score=13.06 TRINITY_DN14201_c0_g1_i1:185-334(-)